MRPSGEFLQNYIFLLWVEVRQPRYSQCVMKQKQYEGSGLRSRSPEKYLEDEPPHYEAGIPHLIPLPNLIFRTFNINNNHTYIRHLNICFTLI